MSRHWLEILAYCQPQNGQFRIFVKSHILYLGIILFIITAITDIKIYILKDNGRPHIGHFCSQIWDEFTAYLSLHKDSAKENNHTLPPSPLPPPPLHKACFYHGLHDSLCGMIVYRSFINFVIYLLLCYAIFKNYSSSPNGLWVNSPWGQRPNGLLTQRPFGLEE